MPPVISNLVFTKTDSTIVATWDTDISSDSNLTVGGNPAPDNGLAANTITGHQCIMPGLLANTTYSCTVTSGGTTSSPQNITTNLAQTRLRVTSATMGSVSNTVNSALSGDTFHNFVASDGFTYMTCDDGNGLVLNSAAAANTQMAKITDEAQMVGTRISLSNYGGFNTTNGTDGPGNTAMTNKNTGLFGINGHLYDFVYRQYPPTYSTNRYCNWIRYNGTGFNNFTALSTFTAGGNPVTPNSPSEPVQFYDLTIGLVCPILYAADDGTLGYNTAGQQIDGANAYVYCTFHKDTTPLYLMRILRIRFDSQTSNAADFQYWIGSQNPAVADFVNNSNWSSSPTSATKLISGLPVGAWYQIVFVPAINSYIMTTWGSSGGNPAFTFYSAVTPAGPWSQFFFRANTGTGTHYYGPFPFHRDFIGNVLTDNIPVRIVFNGEPNATPNNYRVNWATLTMSTAVVPVSNQFVQGDADTTAQSGGATFSKAFPAAVGAAPRLLVIAWRRNSSGSVTGVSDNMGVGNTWTVVFDTSMSGATFGWAYAFTLGAGACTVTVTTNGTVTSALTAVGEWNRPTTVRATTAMRSQNATNSLVSNAATASTGDLGLGLFGTTSGSSGFTATGSGWTGRETSSTGGGASKWVFIEDLLTAVAGSQTATATCGGSLSGTGAAIAFFFANTFHINGATGVAGTVVNYSGGATGSVVADGSGNYSITGLSPGTYLLTPSHNGYTFSPGSQSSTIVLSDINGVNFTPTQVLVSTPTISANSSTVPVQVTITNPDSSLTGFAMYYTLDGSTPTTGSTLYTGPFILTTPKTVKVLAVATDYANSAIATASFTNPNSAGFGCRLTYGF